MTSPTDERPPGLRLREMLTAYWTSMSIGLAAKLGIADLLVGGPKSPAELAKATGTLTEPLYRLLRALASVGIFVEDEQGRFALTPLAEPLRSDVPGSSRAMAIMITEEQFLTWGHLEYSLRTGKIAFDHVYGKPVFDYLAENPDKAKIFDQAMVSVHGRESNAMCDAYDFSAFGTLIDVGGGNGSLLRTVLDRVPTLQGILYDLPHVVERAKANLPARCEAIGGSFFDSVPAYDGRAGRTPVAYLMRHIIHDWDDEKSLTILRNVRKVISALDRLLVVEIVVPAGNAPSFSKFMDLHMMLIPGGKERTETEYGDLFAKAGFRLTRIVPTASDVSMIEGVPD
jgi:hypothetical protein